MVNSFKTNLHSAYGHQRKDSALSAFAQLSINESYRIVVGVDYGTTFTGVSYIHESSTTSGIPKGLGDVNDIRRYPGTGGDTEPWKTPSRIAYRAENQKCNTDKWGFEVGPSLVSYSWTKLLLDRTARTTAFDDPRLKESEGEGMLQIPDNKAAEQVVTDYLEHVYEWVMDHLRRKIEPSILDVTPIEFWFAVPAIWSDKAKAATRSAAIAAGFGRNQKDDIFLIVEPEAAGYAVLTRFSEKTTSVTTARPGDGIIICDCGGGTVDLTSYKIIQLSPKLEFEELVPGIGGKCGSTCIDRQFHQWMSKKFGSRFNTIPFRDKGPGSKFMREFESAKRNFDSTTDRGQEYEITLSIRGAPTSEFYDEDETMVKLRHRDMVEFFEPVVAKVVSLLDDQIQRANDSGHDRIIKQVVLVGGFGDSYYLGAKLKEWCGKKGLSLICPEHPQAAIARGAALRGLERVKQLRRRSRRHYGFVTAEVFRQGTDPEELAIFDKWSGKKRCKRRIAWTIQKGQVITEETTIEREMEVVHTADHDLTYSVKLYSCSADIAPDYETSDEAEFLAEFKHTVPNSYLLYANSKTRNGVRCWLLRWKRQIFLGQKQGTLGFRVVSVPDGKDLGTAEISYDTAS